MKKILIGYITKDLGSGINQYILNFINSIKNENLEIDFVTREDIKLINRIDNMILKDVKYNNIYSISSNKKPITVLKQLNKIMKNRKYDIAYFNISSAYDNLGLIAAKHNKISKIIVHSHSSDADSHNIFKRSFQRFINYFGKIVVGLNANCFLSCSDKAAKWLFPSIIYHSNMYKIIYNAIDKKRFAFDKKKREKVRSKLNIKENFVIGHIARFSLPKNNFFVVDIFKETLKLNSKAKLVCIGDGPDLRKVKKYAKKLGVYDKIIYTGRIGNVEDYMQALDVAILPSLYEGLPITGIEAQFSGLPCLFSEKISSDVIIGNNSKLLPIKDAKVWAQELIKISNRENKLLDCSKNFNLDNSNQFDNILCDKTEYTEFDYKTYHISLLLKQIFLIHYICNLSSYLNGFNYLTIISGLLIIILLLLNLGNLKKILKNRIYILLLLFILSYILSISLNSFFDISTSVKVFIWMFINMFFVNNFMYLSYYKQIKNEIKQVLTLFVLSLGIFNLINLFQLIVTKVGTITSYDGQAIVTGISSWGRFYGVFYDPNYASVICTLSIISCIYLFKKYKNVIMKSLLCFLCLLSFIYICFCESRSGMLTFSIGIFIFLLLFYVINKKKKILKLFLIIVSLWFLILLTPKYLLTTYNKLINSSSKKNIIQELVIDNTVDKNIEKNIVNDNKINIKRSDNKSDISNRRFDIWKSGLELFKCSPLYGVGYGNVVGYAKKNMPKTYIVNNEFVDFRVFHNFIVDIMVNQGIIGIILLLYISGYIIYSIIKNKFFANNKFFDEFALIISCITSLIFSGMFLSQIFYVNNACTFMFWLMFGYLNFYILRCKNEK